MKFYLIILYLILQSISIHVIAVTYQVSGKLKDKDTREILEFATIEFRHYNDSSLYTAAISDSKGEFFIPVEKGKYKIYFRHLGYKPLDKTIEITDRDFFFGDLFLEPDMELISTVTIAGKARQKKIDGEVYIVTDELKKGTSNAKTLLDRIRGVSYDRIDNVIKVDNDNKVAILVDGLQKDQEYAKNISPERIKRVEVIREPSGKYRAERYSAVINLVLKKDYTGFEWYLDERSVFDLDDSNANEPLMINNVLSSFTYTNKKINVYGQYNNNLTHFNLPETREKTMGEMKLLAQPSSPYTPNLFMSTFSNTYTIGIDLFLKQGQVISLESMYESTPQKNNTYFSEFENTLSNSDLIENRYISQSADSSQIDNFYTLLSYIGQVSDKSKINFDFAVNYYQTNITNRYQQTYYSPIYQTSEVEKKYTKANFSYSYTPTKRLNLQIDFSNIWKEIDNEYAISSGSNGELNYSDLQNRMDTYLTFYPNEKWQTKFGGALEFSNTTSLGQKYHYNRIQPYFNLLFETSDQTNITLKFHSDSEYPKIYQLNPMETVVDSISNMKGNPLLAPSTNHRISLETNLLNDKISIEPYYQFSSKYISAVGEISGDKYVYSYNNLDKYNRFGIEFSFNQTILKALQFDFYTDLYQSRVNYRNSNHSLQDISIKGSLLYYSSKHESLVALILKKENNKKIMGYGYYSDNNDYLGVYLQQPFFKNKLELSFLYILPVNLGLDYDLKEKTDNGIFRETKITGTEVLKNMLMVNLVYRFTSGKKVKTITKKNLLEDESVTKGIGF